MINYFRKEFLRITFFLIALILIYISINLTFFSEKSITNILAMKEEISNLKKELQFLNNKEINLLNKIKFLSLENLDFDYISELAQKNIGLIKQDNVLVILDE